MTAGRGDAAVASTDSPRTTWTRWRSPSAHGEARGAVIWRKASLGSWGGQCFTEQLAGCCFTDSPRRQCWRTTSAGNWTELAVRRQEVTSGDVTRCWPRDVHFTIFCQTRLATKSKTKWKLRFSIQFSRVLAADGEGGSSQSYFFKTLI